MATVKIIADLWEGVLNREEVIVEPTPHDVDRLLRRMDGIVHTMVTIQREDNVHLTIGGGSGQYVVYATFDNETFWNLLTPAAGTGKVLLNAGGQEGEYAAKQIVDYTRARKAGLTFLAAGKLDESLAWMRQ